MYAPSTNECPACGGGLRHLVEDVAEQLEYVPASFRVIRHVRPMMACSGCDTIVQASAPSRPIECGIAGPGMLAHVLVAKFADHLPLYRQAVIYARDGVDLDRALLASWAGAASLLLRPLVDAIRRNVLGATKPHADDTPIPVLAPGNGKTRTARLWTYVRDDRPRSDPAPAAVWFAYTPDRKGIHPQTHLANFSGVLQADAYAGFNAPLRRQDSGCCLLGSCATQVLRSARSETVSADGGGLAPDRRALRDRSGHPRQTSRSKAASSTSQGQTLDRRP